MYDRSKGLRQFLIYLLVIILAVSIGLFVGASYPDEINQFFPSVSTNMQSILGIFIASSDVETPVQAATLEEEEMTIETSPEVAEIKPTSDSSLLSNPKPTPEKCIVSTGFPEGAVNIRSGPGLDHPVIGVAYEGDILYLTGPENEEGWAPILTEEKIDGYFYLPKWCK